MKCQKCGATWPDDVKFCGKCGTKLAAASRSLSISENQANQRLKAILPKLGLGTFLEVAPGVHITQKGSTHVEVRVVPMGPQVAVRSKAPVTLGTPITQELLHFLLTENANLLFGAFGIGPKNEIVYTHTIMASSMDEFELGASVSAVLNMADKYDDQIVQRWGGKTMKQTAMESVLAPVLVSALLAGKKEGATRGSRPKTRAAFARGRTMVKPPSRASVDVSQAIKVNGIPEEYAYLAKQRCACGGSLTREAQALLELGGKKYDQLTARCEKCGQEQRFLFDINSFFGKG